ncbi:5527_t:CDS:2, partial [Acaulospora morrowiae]
KELNFKMDLFENPKLSTKLINHFDYSSFVNVEPTSTAINVKKAYLRKLDKNVALKYLRDDKYKNVDEYYENFAREVQSLNKLKLVNSEYIVKFMGIGKGIFYYL